MPSKASAERQALQWGGCVSAERVCGVRCVCVCVGGGGREAGRRGGLIQEAWREPGSCTQVAGRGGVRQAVFSVEQTTSERHPQPPGSGQMQLCGLSWDGAGVVCSGVRLTPAAPWARGRNRKEGGK